MQFFTNIALLGFAAMALANDDPPDGTSTSINGIVVTSRETTTDVGASTTLVPVFTPVVETTTDVGVSTDRTTLSETTDIGTTPTNTIVQFATTTDVNLQSGYAYTTDDSGMTIATFTGTGTAPSLTSTPAAAGGDNNNNDNNGNDMNDQPSSTGGVMPAMTAAPFFAAAAMAGVLAFAG
ncbi:uncharacterized protein RCC_07771 [Ramularia collo-cygni]|uniref:GPI anchored protein n=1 Tax=Ramularia collo-cygni TaxID=112498 RepID=A0A2D3VG56_9PEZI|nr:uncharacterized protein RCC_07771 [Ramularia collo-cygni]CZT21904.1 uncharacterized protein RCC_07771 [Ramularia collo-cygni]